MKASQRVATMDCAHSLATRFVFVVLRAVVAADPTIEPPHLELTLAGCGPILLEL